MSQRKLIISVITLVISLVLFYQGLNAKQTVSSIVVSPDNNPAATDSAQIATISSEIATQIPSTFVLAPVTRIIDGDTFEVLINGQLKKVRYIGINAPETVSPTKPVQCFGKEASDEDKELLTGKSVYLEKDVSETDMYDRLLRDVYLKLDDGSLLFVNDYLVREGFAQLDTFPPDVKYVQRLTQAQTAAKNANLGLWGKCGGQI